MRKVVSLGAIVLAGCVVVSGVKADGAANAGVEGIVLLEGQPPAPTTVQLREDLQKVTGEKTLSIQSWLVGKNQGLANCVVTLEAKDPAHRVVPKPVENALLEKIGASYVPHVLVIPTGTKLTYRNKNSPCKCFSVTGNPLRLEPINALVPAGSTMEVKFEKPDLCQVSANLNPFMKAWIHVVNTPYYALTDEQGRFKIAAIPLGDYQVRVWHEEVGRFSKELGPTEITLKETEPYHLQYKISLPKRD